MNILQEYSRESGFLFNLLKILLFLKAFRNHLALDFFIYIL